MNRLVAYITSLSINEIAKGVFTMAFWLAVIAGLAFFVYMFVLTCREFDERVKYPKEWKRKDEEWKRRRENGE